MIRNILKGALAIYVAGAFLYHFSITYGPGIVRAVAPSAIAAVR